MPIQHNTGKEKIYGLIGRKLGHSFSRTFFNGKFDSEHINARYVNFELKTIEELPAIIATTPRLAGLNVTIPYKEAIIPYLDALDPEAAAIGAVNVIKIYRQPDGSISLKGYNSDAVGFADSLRPIVTDPQGSRALILGTGGASKAIAHALDSLGIVSVKVSRTQGKGAITYGELTPELIKDYNIIVNTTPLGMYPDVDTCPDIPYDALAPDTICYDLIYNPDRTLFMRKAAAAGAVVKNGIEMLLLQAFVAWNIWNK